MKIAYSPLTAAIATAICPPVAKKIDHIVYSPVGQSRNDSYFWLRDETRKSPEMLAYLDAENAYTDAVLTPLRSLRDQIFTEITSRIPEESRNVPYKYHGWWYYHRYQKAENHPLYARRRAEPSLTVQDVIKALENNDFTGEEILINCEQIAKHSSYYMLGDYAVSLDSNKLAYAQDTVGRRQYTILCKDLATDTSFEDRIENASSTIVWVHGNNRFLYIHNDSQTLLGNRVMLHTLGTSSEEDLLVYEEKDDSCYLVLERTRDDRFVLIQSGNSNSTEVLYASTENPEEFRVFQQRQQDVLYYVDHYADDWFMRTNADGAENFKIMRGTLAQDQKIQWKQWVPHDPKIFIEDIVLFQKFAALQIRRDGAAQCVFVDRCGTIENAQPIIAAETTELENNTDPDSEWLRFSHSSLTTAKRIIQMHYKHHKKEVIFENQVPNYDADNYVSERIWITARDGASIPVSLAYKKGFAKDGSGALYLYGYGSYGISIDPEYDPVITSMLDRGIVYAIAHIRGGAEMGRQWYLQGKLCNKWATFHDFIDVTTAMIAQGYSHPERVAAEGGSAGGLLMGVVANIAPTLYRAICARVPFVDVVTTMLDKSIPLTTNEYVEWGNPEKNPDYTYMLSYSPYDNVVEQSYPAIYISTGLWDSQVQYWEPVKWLAKLRTTGSSRPIVCRIHLEAGHGGQAGRFEGYREPAESLAFMCDQLGSVQYIESKEN